MDQRHEIIFQVAAANAAQSGSSTSYEAQPSITVIFPSVHRTGSAETTTPSHRQAQVGPQEAVSRDWSVPKARMRKWLKSFASVFDYRPESLAREQAQRRHWPVVGMGPAHLTRRYGSSQTRPHAACPRRHRRQRDLIQRSDSGVSVKTLPKYNAALGDSEMTLYRTGSDSGSHCSNSGDYLTSPCIAREASSMPSALQQQRRNSLEVASNRQYETGLIHDTTDEAGRIDSIVEEAPAYDSLYPICSTISVAHGPIDAGVPPLQRTPRIASRSSQSRSLIFSPSTAPRMAFADLARCLRSSGEEHRRDASRPSSSRSYQRAEAWPAAPTYRAEAGHCRQSFFDGSRTMSAPVTRSASLVSILAPTSERTREETSSSSSRPQLIESSARQVSPILANCHQSSTRRSTLSATDARRLPFYPPASGYSEQQLAFLASFSHVHDAGPGDDRNVA